MVGFRVNIFHIIAFICSLLLVGYSWFVFLPSFAGLPEYSTIQNVVIVLTVLLLMVSGIQIFLSIRTEEPEE
ncbi:MAG: hypothetical protein ACETV1_05140 [Candidatus Bathyarchaeia archaeon]